jgi:hypothetical protein
MYKLMQRRTNSTNQILGVSIDAAFNRGGAPHLHLATGACMRAGSEVFRQPLSTMSNNGGMRAAPRASGIAAGAYVYKASAVPKPHRQPVQQPQPQATADTATFLSFVRMLASKPEEEQRMLMQVAMQEAAAGPPPPPGHSPSVAPGGIRRSSSAAELRRSPLRRSVSMDGSDFGSRGASSGNGLILGGQSAGGAGSMAGNIMIGGPGADNRPRSADAATCGGSGGSSMQGQALAAAWGASALSVAGAVAGAQRANPLRQRQQQVLQQRAAAQLQQQFVRRAAAATLQAHWRGWQHRRLARYLRARRKRAMRLDWLWHLEYVTNLLQWHEAAHTVQAAFRAKRDIARQRAVSPPSLAQHAARGQAVAPLAAAAASGPRGKAMAGAAKAGAAKAGAATSAATSAAEAGPAGDNSTSSQPATSTITAPPATAETATGSGAESSADSMGKGTGGSGKGLGVNANGARLTVRPARPDLPIPLPIPLPMHIPTCILSGPHVLTMARPRRPSLVPRTQHEPAPPLVTPPPLPPPPTHVLWPLAPRLP